MKTIRHYLDIAKEKTGSDYATAKAIGMTRAGVSRARSNDIIGIEFAVKLADLIGIDPKEVIASADIKAHPENARIWQKWIAAAAILACVGFTGMPVESMDYSVFSMLPFIHYAHIWIGQKTR